MATKATNTTGRRKTSNARVYLLNAKEDFNAASLRTATTSTSEYENTEQIVVNGRYFADYFPRRTAQLKILKAVEITDRVGRYHFDIKVAGGGLSGQMGAVVHGMARALQEVEPELRPILKKAGLLTRDPRAVERKKPGRHKARKRPQFSKR